MIAAAGSTYVLIFLGLVASGDIFLVAMIYSSRLGFISLPILFAIAICASAVSDLIWYLTGRLVKNDRIRQLPMMAKRPQLAERWSKKFESRASFLLFACKFLYGTRVITQILCGSHRMKYIRYFLISIAGTFLWVLFLIALITTVHQSLSVFRGTLTKIEIGGTIVVLLLAGFRFAMKRFLQEKIIEE